MNSIERHLGLVLVLAAMLLLPSAALADGFNLELDPILVEGFYADVKPDSSKFEEYRDVDSDVRVPYLHLRGRSDDGHRWLDLVADDVGRGDQRLTFTYGLAGAYRLTADYNIIPHNFGNDATFLWEATRPGVYEISDATQAALQGQLEAQRELSPSGVNFDFLNGLLRPYIDTANRVDLALERQRTNVSFDVTKLSPLSWAFQVKHEKRRGERPYGGAFGFSSIVEVPEPVEYTTTSLEGSGEWRADRGGMKFGYRMSLFENDNLALRYDNPFRSMDSTDAGAYSAPGAGSINGPVVGQNALPPDNSAHSFWINGRAKLGDNGWLRGGIDFTNMKQNDDLLPYSTNSAINASSGAPFDVTDTGNLWSASADTEVRTLNANVSAGTKLGDHGSVKARYRLYDYDNKSPRIALPGYVRFDAVWEDIPRITVPSDFTRQTFDLGVDFEIVPSATLGVGYRRDMWDRTYREIKDSHDDVLTVRFDGRAGNQFTLRTKYEYGKRSIGDYSTEAQEASFQHPEGINNQPGLRKFDEAARTFNLGSAQLMYAPNDRVDFTVGFTTRKDDYDESELGLLADRVWMFNTELNVHPTSDVSFFVFGNRADRKSEQSARQSGGSLSTSELDTWDLTLDETTDTWGAGLTAQLSERWRAELSCNWNRANGDADFFTLDGGSPASATDFTNYDDSEWIVLKGKLDYQITRGVSAGLMYWYEDFTLDRFSREGLSPLDPYSVASLVLVPIDGDYEAHVVAFNMKFAF